MPATSFDDLLAEGASVPTDGWDFSWFDGRATEERPPWGYAARLAERLGSAESVLDLQTGGGEVLAWALASAVRCPATVAATESWGPNLSIARARLAPFAGTVAECPDEGPLPFADGAFDLVCGRHPVSTPWPEVARVLRSGATFFSQQVGAGSNRELIDFLMGPRLPGSARRPERAVAEAEAAGLEVVDLRTARLRAEFRDVGAVVHFLRKVCWTVPGFDIATYRDRLAKLHEAILRDGPFVCHAERFLIEARRPG